MHEKVISGVLAECESEVLSRIMPIVIETGFFQRTRFKSLDISITNVSPWNRETGPYFDTMKGSLWARRLVHYEDFVYLTPDELLNFETRIAAGVIVAMCEKFGLDISAAEALQCRYPPIAQIELCRTKFAPSVNLIEPNIDQLATGLTDRDLVFPSGDNYKFAAQEPFTKTELERIGPQTRNVFVSLGLPPDQYVEISNAMLRAPSARLRIRGYNPYLDPDLDCLKYFCHLRRIVFEHFQHGDLEALRQLSPDLISLEIHFAASKKERASLAPLQHFKALKSLALIGHYEDLSRFPNLYSLEALLLSEVSIKDLSSLAAQKRLRSLVLHRSKIKDVSALSSLYRLQYLALAALPELASVEAMTGLDNLEYLELSYLPKIEGLPSLSKLSRLRRVDIVALKSSRDLKPIMDAPTLQHLYLGEMKQLESGDLYCIAQHPTVKGFDTDNLAFEKALGLPRIGPTKHFTFTEVPPMRPEPAMEAMNVSSSQKPEASDEESGETPPEELRIHFALNSWFGSSDELLECHDLEERLQQMIEGDLVGRWDGQEVGAGFYSVFMVGPSTEAMYECIRNELLLSAPKGSYVELEDAEGDLIRSIQLPTLSEKAT